MKAEDFKKLKEPLDIENVDFRIQSINKGGYATILAYKNARVDMERLDSVCGPQGWQRDHKEFKSNIYCGIGIKCDDEWVWKWDAGAESYSDKEKGEASDSFKRSGFNWGIGRELYNYPIISAKLKSNEFKIEKDRAKQTWELKLKEWSWFLYWDDDQVGFLVAFDQSKITRYIYSSSLNNLEKLWDSYAEIQTKKHFADYIGEIKKQLS